MKILHLIPELNFGGAETVMLQFIRMQVQEGNEVHIVTFSKNEQRRNFAEIEIHNCGNESAQLSLLGKNICNQKYEVLLDVFNPDIIHSHSESTMHIALANKRISPSYIFHFHRFPKSSTLGLIKRKSETFLIKSLIKKYHKSQIIFVSNALKESFFKRFPGLKSLAKDIHILGNPISKFGQSKSTETINAYRILTISRLEKEKNILHIPEIVKELLQYEIQFTWSIYGEGSQKEELINKIQNYNIQEHLNLRSATEEIDSIYPKFDVYLSVSEIETFGLSILEAMSKGLIVLLLPNEGSKDFIMDGENAFIISCDNPASQALMISNILSGEKQNLGAIASKAIETAHEFDINKIYSRLKEIYSIARSTHR